MAVSCEKTFFAVCIRIAPAFFILSCFKGNSSGFCKHNRLPFINKAVCKKRSFYQAFKSGKRLKSQRKCGLSIRVIRRSVFVGVKCTDVIFRHFPSIIGDYKSGRIQAMSQMIQRPRKMLLLCVIVKSGDSPAFVHHVPQNNAGVIVVSLYGTGPFL